MAALIRFEALSLGYDREAVVRGLETSIAPGSLTAIVGPNGAGKSTLLKAVVGSLEPLAGRIVLAEDGRATMAYLPQRAEIDTTFPLTVLELVAMGLWREVGPFGGIGRRFQRRLDAALQRVGLPDLARQPIGSLSGGQLQRALFARLLVQDAPLILLDEPFTAIDARTTADLVQLVAHWHGEGRTVVAVLHDLEQVRRHFPQTLLLARELIGHGRTAEVLVPANLERARNACEQAAHCPLAPRAEAA